MVQQTGATAILAMAWAAVACAPGEEPHAPPQRVDSGSDIGDHCAALAKARVHSPGCDGDDGPVAPSRDASAPNTAGDATAPAAEDSGSDAAPSAPSPHDGGVDARAPTEPDAGAAPGPQNDCCTTSTAPGCNDSTVLACVCAGDAFCCSNEYDAVCITQAASLCDIDCDERPPVSDCCSPNDVPGCAVASVAACVCDEDPFCCVFRFDENCVNLAKARCSASCTPEVRP